MDEYISSEKHHAEVAALQNEIYNLTRYINEKESHYIKANMNDPCDPFANPTEYHEYQEDYTEIQPLIAEPDYKPEFEPLNYERSKLKNYYAVAGWCNLLRFFVAFAIWQVLYFAAAYLLRLNSPGADDFSINIYISGTAISGGINMLSFGLTNVIFAAVGFRLAGQKRRTFGKTKDYTFINFIEYSFIGFFLWFLSVVLGNACVQGFSLVGIKIIDGDAPATAMGMAVYAVYSCIIAPITEEIFYRGMMLKMFSRANQRFGIFCSALMFGLGHGNIPQLILGFILGIFLGHITIKHNSLIPAMIVHATLNTMNTVISMIQFTVHEELLLLKTEMLVAFIGFLVLGIFAMRNKLPMTTPAQVRRGTPVAMGSVGFILCVTVHICYMLANIYTLNMNQ